MDKETEAHLKEYRTLRGQLQEKLNSLDNLIRGIEAQEGEVHTAEHDFPNFAKYNKGTDI